MRAVVLALAIAAAPIPDALKAAASDPAPGSWQVLARGPQGAPLVARVAVGHALPGWAEERMRLGGTWCYLIADQDGVWVTDAGPRYPLGWCLLPWGAPKGLLTPMAGPTQIVAALDALFPGRPALGIVLTHWHPDHTEAAPDLEALLARRDGHRPTLRIMAADRAARGNGVMAGGAEAVFRAAGYRPGDWTWGPDLADGQALGRSGFSVLALPGHTRGDFALVDPALRLAIGPPPKYLPGAVSEAPGEFGSSMLKFYQATYGFKHYCVHPGPEIQDDWPTPPWGPPRKR